MRALKSISSAFSSRRSSVVVKPAKAPFCEILVHGYGNGMNRAVIGPPSAESQAFTSPSLNSKTELRSWTSGPEVVDKEPLALRRLRDHDPAPIPVRSRPSYLRLSTAPVPASENLSRSPILEAFQLDHIHEPSTPGLTDSPVSARDSNSYASGPLTPTWSSASEGGCSRTSTASTSKRNSVSSSHYGTAPPSPVMNTKQAFPRSWTSPYLDDSPPRYEAHGYFLANERDQVVIRNSVSLESLRLGTDDVSGAKVDTYSALDMLPERPVHARHSAVDLGAPRPSTADMSSFQEQSRWVGLKVGDVVRDVSQVSLPISKMMGKEARQQRRMTFR